MNSVTSTPLVHYFDAGLRRILCGVRGPDHRSTKHSRGVTCAACIGLLGERPRDAAAAPNATTDGSAPLGSPVL